MAADPIATFTRMSTAFVTNGRAYWSRPGTYQMRVAPDVKAEYLRELAENEAWIVDRSGGRLFRGMRLVVDDRLADGELVIERRARGR